MKRHLVHLTALALLLSACEFSLAGDITPPPDADFFGDATSEPVVFPSTTPDAEAGGALYIQNCAPCHGLSGLGDGEQAAQLPFAPAPLGDPDLARAASPEDWFRIVSAGRLQRYMPPFSSALTSQQRWDVLAYVYSLGWDEDLLHTGNELYLQRQTEIDQLLAGVNPFAVELDLVESLGLPEQDATALTAFLQARAFGLEQPAAEATATPLAEASQVLASFIGHVKHGSEEDLPAGLEATLFGFDHTEQVFSQTALVRIGGDVVFEDVPLAEGRVFFIQVDYQGQSYFSEFITSEGQETLFRVPITIYETTSDVSQLAVDGIQLIFNFAEPGAVRVVERVTITNLGDRAVVPNQGEAVLRFTLPQGASNLVFQDGELGDRFVATGSGFGDLRGVLPGQGYELFFAYELPYSDGLIYQTSVDLPTRTLVAFIPEGEIELSSEDFQLAGSQAFDGVNHLAYAADAGYFPGDQLALELRGPHPLGGSAPTFGASDDLLAGLAALTAAVGLAWLWLRRLPAAGTPLTAEAIMDEILALDERYANGKVSEAVYAKRRASLKAQLAKKMIPRGKR